MPFLRSSLNHEDVFILDTATKIFLFSGCNSTIQERAKGLEVVQYIKENKHGGKCEVATIGWNICYFSLCFIYFFLSQMLKTWLYNCCRGRKICWWFRCGWILEFLWWLCSHSSRTAFCSGICGSISKAILVRFIHSCVQCLCEWMRAFVENPYLLNLISLPYCSWIFSTFVLDQ